MSDEDIIRHLQEENAQLWKVNTRLSAKLEKLRREPKWSKEDADNFVASLRGDGLPPSNGGSPRASKGEQL